MKIKEIQRRQIFILSIGLVIMLSPSMVFAQPFAFFADSLSRVSYEIRGMNREIPQAYTGGMKAPILSNMDLNRDQVLDLVVFDRASSRVMCFIAVNDSGVIRHRYAPQFEAAFPRMRHWMLLRDFNGDGLMDIFTSEFNRAGIRVFTNFGFNNQNMPDFRLSVPLLESTLLSGAPAPYYANVTDVPFIGDIDADGDLDIINQDFAGFGFELHLNLSVDSTNRRDLQLRKITNCFGGIAATATCGRYLFNPCRGIPEEEPYSGARRMHAGATINLTDLNDDDNLDLILGDISCRNANAFFNASLREPIGFSYPLLNTAYPGDTLRPHLGTFILANLVDINFDNKVDMIFSNNDVISDPRADANNFYFIPWLANELTTNPRFTLSSTNFIFPQVYDIGSNSRPVAFDWDRDGDEDIIMSHEGKGSDTLVTTAFHFFNNRVNEGLGLQITDTNFLNSAALNWRDVRLSFGFLNADSLPELIVHRRVNFDFITEIYLNRGVAANPYDFRSPLRFANYDVEPYDSYAFTDITGDGLDDMLVGRAFGRLDFYENAGLDQRFINLTNEIRAFGDVNLSARRPQEMNLALGHLNRDSLNRPDLVIGTSAGDFFIYPDVSLNARNAPLFVDTLINRRSLNFIPTKPILGNNAYPAIGNFAHDSLPDLLFGNIAGGITVLANKFNSGLQPVDSKERLKTKLLSVYPNPATDRVFVKGLTGVTSFLWMDITGRVLSAGFVSVNDNVCSVPQVKGVYLLKIGAEVFRIVKE